MHLRTLFSGASTTAGEWTLFVEAFFLDTYNWTRVKYGKLNDKLYASLDKYGRQLDWKKVFSDFKKYCQNRGKKFNEIFFFTIWY